MKIILSCTTTYERRDLFYYGIQSLLKQSLKPDLFLVNISKKSFLEDVNRTTLPDWFIQEGATINDTEDIGPYTKFLPALDYSNDDDLIITVDDDVIYSEHLIRDLYEAWKKETDTIVCTRGKRMNKNIFNNWRNYNHWPVINEKDIGLDVLPLGVGGVLYRKKLLDLDFIRNKKFLEIAPSTDDLWFKMASLRKDIKVSVWPKIYTDNIQLLHGKGLEQINHETYNQSKIQRVRKMIMSEAKGYLGINNTKNDKNWDAICDYVRSLN